MTKIIWEAKKTPFCRVDLHHAHSIVTAASTSRGPLRALLLELWGRRVAQPYFPRQNTELSVRGRERALLSSSKDKRALWLHRGPKSVPSALPWTWQQNRQSGDTPLPTTVSGLTYWKQKQQKKKQGEIYTNFLRCCSREAQADQGLSPSLLFLYVKRKKKFKEVQSWSTGSKHHSLDLRQMAETKVLNRACFRCADVLGSWKRAVSWQNDVGSWGYKLGEGLSM